MRGKSTRQQQAIVFNPQRTREAIDRAQAALNAGRYQAAADHLAPLSTKLPAQFAAPVLEMLGVCALAGVGRDWPGLLRRARTAYQLLGDAAGAARVQQNLGQAWLGRGEFSAASQALHLAAENFASVDAPRGQAATALLLVRLALRRGAAVEALSLSHRAIKACGRLKDSAQEAIAHLQRAQVLAVLQRPGDAAPDLLWAERLGGAEATLLTRVRLGLARAKVLIDLGHHRRAAVGLSRLQPEVEALGALPYIADHARCLGLAQRQDDPAAARQSLTRARQLHEQLGQTYHVAECDLGLAQADLRLAQPIGARLDVLRAYNLTAWPLLEDTWRGLSNVRPRTATQPVAPLPTPVTEPTLVQRLGALLGRMLTGETPAAQPVVAAARDEAPSTAWGPLVPVQHNSAPAKSRRKKKPAAQQEEEGVNYTASIRSASMDMRV